MNQQKLKKIGRKAIWAPHPSHDHEIAMARVKREPPERIVVLFEPACRYHVRGAGHVHHRNSGM